MVKLTISFLSPTSILRNWKGKYARFVVCFWAFGMCGLERFWVAGGLDRANLWKRDASLKKTGGLIEAACDDYSVTGLEDEAGLQLDEAGRSIATEERAQD